MNTIPKYGTAFPDYCPDDITEDAPCYACGADARITRQYCRAKHTGPAPRPLLEIVLVDKRTGETVR